MMALSLSLPNVSFTVQLEPALARWFITHFGGWWAFRTKMFINQVYWHSQRHKEVRLVIVQQVCSLRHSCGVRINKLKRAKTLGLDYISRHKLPCVCENSSFFWPLTAIMSLNTLHYTTTDAVFSLLHRVICFKRAAVLPCEKNVHKCKKNHELKLSAIQPQTAHIWDISVEG